MDAEATGKIKFDRFYKIISWRLPDKALYPVKNIARLSRLLLTAKTPNKKFTGRKNA